MWLFEGHGGHTRPRVKSFLLITALLLILLSLTLTAYFLASAKVLPPEDFDFDDYEDEENAEPPEDLSCAQITRTRSRDEAWSCMVYGPTKFLLPDERAKIDAEIQQPGKEAFRILLKKPPNNQSKILKRFKRALHGPYQVVNEKEYLLKIEPVKASEDSSRIPANDPFWFDPVYMYKLTHETWQAQPPWSYTGDYGVKDWHTLNLDKFLVPINKKLDPINKENRLMRAVFTDLWDEFMFTGTGDVETKFQNFFFPPKKDRNDNPKSRRSERLRYYRMFYSHPYPDKRMKGYDFKPPKVIVQQDALSKIDLQNEAFQSLEDNVDPSLRALTDDVKPRPLDANRTAKDSKAIRDDKDSTGYYSFMRFYIANRPSQEDIDKNPNVLSPSFLRDVPPEGASFKKILKLIKKVDDPFVKFHPLTTEERKFIKDIKKLAKSLDWKEGLVEVDFNHTLTQNQRLIKFIEDKLETGKLQQQRLQSQYSIDIFPVKFPICADKEPSPLDIITDNAVNSSFVPYVLDENGYRFFRFLMYFPADGTSNVFIQWDDATREKRRAIRLEKGGPPSLQTMYFEVLNIKIGMDRGKGSEHRIDGKQYDMELQFMFTTEGPSQEIPYWFTLSRQFNDLFPYRGKLVHIVSVLVTVDDTLTPTSDEALLFEPFAQTAYQMRRQIEAKPTGDHFRKFLTTDFPVRMIDFIPKDSVYYSYRGGLTTPPCFSYITWSVFERPLKIMPQQYTEFKFLKAPAENSGFMAGNIRTPEDIWTSYENAPGILPSEKQKRKEERINRAVVRSLHDTGNKTEKSEVYDYYFDYDGGRIPKPCGVLILLLSVYFIFQI